MHRLIRIAVTALAISMALVWWPHEANGDVIADARSAYEKGVKAHQAGEYAKAVDLFKRSYDLVKHSSTLKNLAASEARADKKVQAARHYRELLAGTVEPKLDAPTTKEVETALSELERTIGRIRIAVDEDGATVTVDGELVGKSPLIDPIHVEPGQHEVMAQKTGVGAKSVKATAVAGEIATATLKLAESTDAAVAPTATATSDAGMEPPASDAGTRDSNGAKTAVVLTGVGLTVVALGVGIGFGLDSSSKKSDADDLSEKLGPQGCSGSSKPAECSTLTDKRDGANRSAKIGTVGFVAAGVFGLATAATWFLWPEAKPKQTGARSRFGVAPVLGPTNGLQVHGTF